MVRFSWLAESWAFSGVCLNQLLLWMKSRESWETALLKSDVQLMLGVISLGVFYQVQEDSASHCYSALMLNERSTTGLWGTHQQMSASQLEGRVPYGRCGLGKKILKLQWCELTRVGKRIWEFLGQPHQMAWRTSVMFIRVSGPCVWLKDHPLSVWAGNLLDPAQEKHSRPPLVACSGTWKAKFLVVAGRVVMPGNVYSNTGEQLGERCFTVEGLSGYYANKERNSFPPKFRRAWSRPQCI